DGEGADAEVEALDEDNEAPEVAQDETKTSYVGESGQEIWLHLRRRESENTTCIDFKSWEPGGFKQFVMLTDRVAEKCMGPLGVVDGREASWQLMRMVWAELKAKKITDKEQAKQIRNQILADH
ncbi:unnamed protein product, partial [Prorocentrum cordatum]